MALVRVVTVECPDCGKENEVYYVGTWNTRLFCNGCFNLYTLMPKPGDTIDD